MERLSLGKLQADFIRVASGSMLWPALVLGHVLEGVARAEKTQARQRRERTNCEFPTAPGRGLPVPHEGGRFTEVHG